MFDDEASIDKIETIDINKEMQTSYIDYAMSVIVARALPDVRDGLKPVHRRILYAMNELNLAHNQAYKKSARIVGDAMGKYHPHGETAIYDAMVRMAQDFSYRYMLVEGQGNFGSIDGDMAAAQRYTEAKLSRISGEMLKDIHKETVDYVPNYNEEFLEPTVMPSRFPNLLVNGSVGIAVGMATNIPPHNLNEIVDGILRLIHDKMRGHETTLEELMEDVKGPDFPTGAQILGYSGIKEAYETGRGKVYVRAICNITQLQNGREVIIVTELPYQVNKSRLIRRIADVVKEKRVDGITAITDSSDRKGMKIVIDIHRDSNATVVLNNLYKYTQLQETFGIIMLALVNGQPKTLSLHEMMRHYIDHQQEVITRRTQFDLNRAEKRAHLVEGFIKALDHIDEIISIIRENRDINVSKEIIIARFDFTTEQADAIVDMRLRNLSGLEREKLENEFGELSKTITYLRGILSDEHTLFSVLIEELIEIKNIYGDERRTAIVPYQGDIDILDLIDDEMNVITMTKMNYIKRLALDTYRSQHRGGRGIMGMTAREEDIVDKLVITSTHEEILFFTNLGKVYHLFAYEIPETSRTARGTNIVNLLNLDKEERVTSIIPIENFKNGCLMMVTQMGTVKKTHVSNYGRIQKGGLIALTIRAEDALVNVLHTHKGDNILLVTKGGKGICFDESDVREMGRPAMGVMGIRLAKEDEVIGAEIASTACKLLTVSAGGYGKRTEVSEFRTQKRGGKGVIVHKLNGKTGKLVGSSIVSEEDEFMIINSDGVIIRIRVEDISVTGRIAMGVKLINLEENTEVVDMAKINWEDLDEEESETDEEAVDPENPEDSEITEIDEEIVDPENPEDSEITETDEEVVDPEDSEVTETDEEAVDPENPEVTKIDEEAVDPENPKVTKIDEEIVVPENPEDSEITETDN